MLVIYWANNKLKQPNSINSHYNKNGLLCIATAWILAAIMYFLTVIGYLKKKHHEVLCLSFIDNSNNYIIALEIAYYFYLRTYAYWRTNQYRRLKKMTLVITNAVSLEQQWHKPYIIC